MQVEVAEMNWFWFGPLLAKLKKDILEHFRTTGFSKLVKIQRRKSGQTLNWFSYPAWDLLHVWTNFSKELNVISTEKESASASASLFKDSLQLWLSKATNWSTNLEKDNWEKYSCCWSACSKPNHTERKKILVTIQIEDFSLEYNLHSFTNNNTFLNRQSHLDQHAESKQNQKDRQKGLSQLK